MQIGKDVIGLLPAGGKGARIEPLPCSKELFPIGFRKVDGTDCLRPKAVSHYLLEKMRRAGIRKAFFILREGKWDIPKYFGDGAMVDMNLGYLMMRVPFGPPYTLDQAYSFVEDSIVAFGFPDILFEGEDAFSKLLDRYATTHADVVLGLYPVKHPRTMDMVDIADDGHVRSIVIKPDDTLLKYGWVIAVWSPKFTRFLHGYLEGLEHGQSSTGDTISSAHPELSVGHVLQAALSKGILMKSVVFPHHSYIDIGTPTDLVKAVYDPKFQKNTLSE